MGQFAKQFTSGLYIYTYTYIIPVVCKNGYIPISLYSSSDKWEISTSTAVSPSLQLTIQVKLSPQIKIQQQKNANESRVGKRPIFGSYW